MDASFVQTDFRGGEWSPYAQGRLDDKEYPRGLNVCYNSYPIEEGAWTRRPGTRWIAQTAGGAYAWLLSFHFAQTSPYVIELTDSSARFYAGPSLVFTADVQDVASVSTATPAVVTTATAHGWNSNDNVQFIFSPGAVDLSGASTLFGRQFIITKITNTTFSLADPVSGQSIDGTTFTIPPATTIGRVLTLASPYTEVQLQSVRSVQTEQLSNNVLQGQVVLLHNAVTPRVVVNTTPSNSDAFAQFTMSTVAFTDGPYFDPVAGTVSTNALSGTVTLSAAPANTFVATDVGRSVRLFSEPPAWASGTAYAAAAVIKYSDGNYYTALAASTNKPPSTNPTLWAINSTAAGWTWGTIASFISGTSVTVAIKGPALFYTGTITTWRLGLYSDTTGYPTCGVFHEGRLWLGGAQGNRFDASNSNDPFNMAPTAADGTVGDSNAISYIFNADDVNPILWMKPDHAGIVCGTAGGEWVISASQLNDPLTPTSIQAHRVTKYKCANVDPVRAGNALLFVQLQQKRLFEYVSDAYSGKFLGRNVTEKSRHLTGSNIAQLAYQQDLTPIVWARMADGTLAGMTYKREASFTSEPPTFTGWHAHTLGSGGVVESICTGPNADGTLETLTMSVLDPITGARHVEMMTDMFDEQDTIAQAWFVDGGTPPGAILEDLTNNTVKMTGLYTLIGRTVSVWLAGLDLGDFLVAADGSITIPFAGLLTDAYLQTFVNKTTTAWDVPMLVKKTIVDPSPGNMSIQSYINTSQVTGATDAVDFIYDGPRDRIIVCSFGTGATAGFKVYRASTGAYLGGITAPALFATINKYTYAQFSNPASNVVQGPFAIDSHAGYLYFPSDSSNMSVLREVDFTDPTNIYIRQNFGKQSGTNTLGGLTSDATHLSHPENMCGVQAGADDFILTCGAVGSTGVSVLQPNMSQSSHYGNRGVMHLVAALAITETGCDCCEGFQSGSGKKARGNAFVLGHTNNDAASTAAISLYHVGIKPDSSASYSGANISTIVSLTPAQIDATWSHFTVVRGPVFDKTDGNVIIWVQTSDAVVNQSYVLKINTGTGAISWKTAVGDIPNNRTGLNLSNVQYQKLAWLFFNRLYICNTSSGAVATSTIVGTHEVQAQCSDDTNGTLYCAGNYTSGGGAPIGLNGTVSFAATEWFRLQGLGFGQASATQLGNIPNVPACIGFTFTSQGQILRPVAQAATGARNGPGWAKTRRTQKIGAQLANTQGISFGVTFATVVAAELKSDGVNINALSALYTGVLRTEIDCPYDFDSMICWQITRPYPATVTAIGGFLATQDI